MQATTHTSESIFEQELKTFLDSNKPSYLSPGYKLDNEEKITNFYFRFLERAIVLEDVDSSIIYPLEIHIIHPEKFFEKECVLIEKVQMVYHKAIERGAAPKKYEIHHHQSMRECNQILEAAKPKKNEDEYNIEGACCILS